MPRDDLAQARGQRGSLTKQIAGESGGEEGNAVRSWERLGKNVKCGNVNGACELCAQDTRHHMAALTNEFFVDATPLPFKSRERILAHK